MSVPMVIMYIFSLVMNQNIFFHSDAVLKVSQQDKSLKSTLRLKTVIFGELWNVRDYIGTVGDDATSSTIEM